MLHIFMDSKCHQAIRHLGTESIHYPNPRRAGDWKKIRLSGFIDLLHENNFDFSLVDIEHDPLDNADVLIIAGRSNILDFSKPELDAFKSYYDQNGNIFLMANHNGLVRPQNQISTELNLPITFHEITIQEVNQNLILESSHPISTNCDQGLHIRTSCSMTVGQSINTEVIVRNENPEIGIFATASEAKDYPSKRVISITSSGHISSNDDFGRNLFEEASNSKWTMNAIKWLAGTLT